MIKINKGITLIVLIITIIIMLILTAVTITFVVNGGLIGQTKEATELMQKAVFKERLESDIAEAMTYLDITNQDITLYNVVERLIDKNGYRLEEPLLLEEIDEDSIVLVSKAVSGKRYYGDINYNFDVYVAGLDDERDQNGSTGGYGGISGEELTESQLDFYTDKIKIVAYPTTWTNQSVTVTITYPNISGTTKQYSLNGGDTWETYTDPILLFAKAIVSARLVTHIES